MWGVIKFLCIIGKNFGYLLNVDRNALANIPDYAKFFSMVLLSCFWALAFGLYVGELLFIGYSMLGHIALITMCFVTWWVFKGYRDRARFRSKNDYSWLRAPDRSSRCDELTEEQRIALVKQLNNRDIWNTPELAERDRSKHEYSGS